MNVECFITRDKIQAKKKKEEERGTRRQPKYIHALLKKVSAVAIAMTDVEI